jgi:hypothetical protein
MTLKPTDMLEIQSAIDAYERKFPRRPAPTAEVALAWRLGKKEWARRQAAQRMAEQAEEELIRPTAATNRQQEKARDKSVQPETHGLLWLLAQMRLRWQNWCDGLETSGAFEDSTPLVKGVLRASLWGVAAVLVASVFLLGAIVGGFK